MKKLIAIAAVALCASAFAELKIGTVDMMTLVRNHKNYDTNKKLLQDAERDYQKKLDAMKADIDAIQDEGKKIAEQGKNPMLAQSQKDKIQNRYIGAQQKLRSEAMESQQKLQEFETRLLKITTDEIREIVNKYAEKNDYDLIVESTVTAFAKKSLNVTDDLLREMGVDPKNAKGKERGKDEGK